MSFWNLITGKPHDLEPEEGPSVSLALLPRVAMLPVAIGTTAISIAAIASGSGARYPFGLVNHAVWRAALTGVSEISPVLDDVARKRQGLAEKRLQQAIAYYERAILLNPESSVVWANLGISYAALGDLKNALRCWTKAVDLNPNASDIWLRMGTALLQVEDPKSAIESFRKCLEIDAANASIWSNLAVAYKAVGNVSESLACITEALNLSPADAPAWFNRATLLWQLGRKQEAVQSWNRAEELDSTLQSPWRREQEVGRDADRGGKPESALLHFENALQWNPEFPHGWLGKGMVLLQCNRTQEALLCFQRAVELDQNLAEAWLHKGNVESDLGRMKDAQISWTKAYSVDPAHKVPWIKQVDLGIEALGGRNFNQALKHFDQALSQYSDCAEAWFRKGVALRALGRAQEALRCWKTATTIRPTLGMCWFNQGNLLVELGEPLNALQCFTHAVAVDGSLSQAWINKGALLADCGNALEAMECFQRARDLGSPAADRPLRIAEKYAHMDPAIGPV